MTTHSTVPEPERGLVPINGLEMYYEVHGAGEPLVLLHGGITTIELSFGAILPALSENRQIIAVEQQAHGRTRDIDRPLNFVQMAEDTAALLRHLEITSADFFGYSDGGNVALGLAIHHPDLVRKLIVAGTNYNNDGLKPEILEMMAGASADQMPDMFRDAYTSVAPEPENWPVLVRKVMDLAVEFPGWSADEIESINAPTLVVIGDSDIVRPEHAVEMLRLLPNGQLAVLPGTDHVNRLDRPALLLNVIAEFLDAQEGQEPGP